MDDDADKCAWCDTLLTEADTEGVCNRCRDDFDAADDLDDLEDDDFDEDEE